MDYKCALREETAQLVADYLDYCSRREGFQARPPTTPAAATMRSVAKELRRRYQDFFECAQNQLLDQSPEQVITEVAELMSQGEFNWGRVAVLVVFAGALLEMEEPQKEERVQPLRREMSRRLTEELCNYLVEKKGAWLRDNGGWTGFHHHFTQKQSSPQSDPSSTLCCIMAAAAGFGLVGLALLLAVR
ncbi:LOW QUALITY PROTEIN: bcl-2-like protein 10 [Phascolarctos cinereus]|uniref:LOW QUALITY PROTEIN: bcl-2-like protein 10 n=1 Tax=Phascolarctos cinereus TaxID=38626 RepID=A0A6P5JT98_PHACI|nr:LOW QUALITY PROTEIN: bcl-2-like protein 10 [Phascolarctos cinereus]